MLQNDAIVTYPNNSNILSSVVQGVDIIIRIPPYELNKYILDGINFQFLLSKSEDPFSATLSDNQNNICEIEFELISNVNISSPKSNDTLISNTYSNINLNSFLRKYEL